MNDTAPHPSPNDPEAELWRAVEAHLIRYCGRFAPFLATRGVSRQAQEQML